jgi:hypothetical protein
MPQRANAIVERHPANGVIERNQAAIQLIDAWLREDALSTEPDTWEQLKAALDRDRPSDRKLFR